MNGSCISVYTDNHTQAHTSISAMPQSESPVTLQVLAMPDLCGQAPV